MTIDKMYRKTKKTIDALMFKHGFFAQNKIDNPTGFIVEYVGQFDEAFLVVYDENWRVTNVL